MSHQGTTDFDGAPPVLTSRGCEDTVLLPPVLLTPARLVTYAMLKYAIPVANTLT